MALKRIWESGESDLEGELTKTSARYLDHVRADGDRFVQTLGGDLGVAVPTCPEWSAKDLVVHLGVVHRNKAHQVREAMLESCPVVEMPAEGEDLTGWYLEGLETLLGSLGAADATRPVWSWHPFQWNAAFWARRMAHETAIHRVDAELAAGDRTPIPPTLALDGVDEMLDVWLARRPRLARYDGTGASVAVSAGSGTWVVGMHGANVVLRRFGIPDTDLIDARAAGFEDGPLPPVDATVSGNAEDMYLWLWGRVDDDSVTIEGSSPAAQELRDQIRAIT